MLNRSEIIGLPIDNSEMLRSIRVLRVSDCLFWLNQHYLEFTSTTITKDWMQRKQINNKFLIPKRPGIPLAINKADQFFDETQNYKDGI